nr:Hok/Gef family protein [Escherichia coli]
MRVHYCWVRSLCEVRIRTGQTEVAVFVDYESEK